jgi:MFS family permease
VLTLVSIAAICNAVQFPGLSSAIPRFLPTEHFGRANGAVHLGMAVGQMAAPTAAAALLVAGGIWTILVIDALSFLFASVLLLAIRFPHAARGTAAGAPPRNVRAGASRGWRYIRSHAGFIWLIALLALMNFNLGIAQVLMAPLVLSFADVHVLGRVMSIAGMGMAAGSVLLMIWGGPKRRIHGVLGFALLESVSLLLMGALSPSASLVAACAFGVLCALPLLVGCSQLLWQHKVPAAIQGSVFGVRFMVTKGVVPFAFLLAGPLSDRVFEPMMRPRGALANSVGAVMGTGPGRGIALLFIVLGLLSTLGVALAASSQRLRRLEEELPDDGLVQAPASGELADCPS